MEPIAVSSGSLSDFYLGLDTFASSNAIDEHLLNTLTRHPEFSHSFNDTL
jgi:hypothetical protein